MTIEDIRTFLFQCPYLDSSIDINVDYLVDKIKAYSVSEATSYNPVVSKDIIGNEQKQFQFYFDIKLYWNEEVQNNIDNSKLFQNISSWIENKNSNKEYPSSDSNIEIYSMLPTTNGYILDNNEDEAIYRIAITILYNKYK